MVRPATPLAVRPNLDGEGLPVTTLGLLSEAAIHPDARPGRAPAGGCRRVSGARCEPWSPVPHQDRPGDQGSSVNTCFQEPSARCVVAAVPRAPDQVPEPPMIGRSTVCATAIVEPAVG